MNYKELNEAILARLSDLTNINSDFNVSEIDEDQEWYDDVHNTDNEGPTFYGSLSNYLIFIEKRSDNYYVSLLAETEPLMTTNDWLFGRGIKPSDLDYEFNDSAYDVANDWSFENAAKLWSKKI